MLVENTDYKVVNFILTFSEECMKLHSEIPDAAKNLSVIKTNHKKITCHPTDSINSTDNCKCYIDQIIRIVYCLSRHAFNGNWLLLCLEIWLWKHLIFQMLTISLAEFKNWNIIGLCKDIGTGKSEFILLHWIYCKL